MNLRITSLLIATILLYTCKTNQKAANSGPKPPKNVILLIGDGTGLTQISSAFYFKETDPNYGRFNHIGLINTSSSRQDITDSAAGATAFASGIKTYNGAVGVADDSTEVETIVEIISPKGINTGVIATSTITHATPASFYGHVINRGMEEDLAEDLVNSEIDFFAGGGANFFYNRMDGSSLEQTMKENKFVMDTASLGSFTDIKSHEKVGYLLAKGQMSPSAEGRGDYLPRATELGIQFLNKDNNNFFLMVEGSQVDWGGHANNAEYLISELIDFDNAIGKALDFAENEGNTLVVVTADHETGGFTLSSTTKTNEEGRQYSDYNEITGTFSTGGHSATLIPVFAYGPGAEEFSGIYQNSEIFHKIMKVTQWDKFND
jgi:alkaline phosphatase